MPSIRKKRRVKKAKTRRKLPINVAASLLTTLALYSGISSIFASINQDFKMAAYWILAAIILDTFDGMVARLTNSESDFGKELDSLADIVSFGIAPAVLIYTAFLLEERMTGSIIGPTGSMMAIVYVICGALRLARYNVYQSDRSDAFVGLPIPAAAGNVASFTLFTNFFELQVAYWVFGPFIIGLTVLMVSNILFPKKNLKIFVLAPRKAFQALVLCVIGIAAFHYARQYSVDIVWLPLGLTYVLFGLVNGGLARMRHVREKPAPIEDGHSEETILQEPHKTL